MEETAIQRHNILFWGRAQEALNTIAQLPEDADMEEIMYRLYLLDNIRKGQEDAAQGKTQSVDKVLSDIKTW